MNSCRGDFAVSTSRRKRTKDLIVESNILYCEAGPCVRLVKQIRLLNWEKYTHYLNVMTLIHNLNTSTSPKLEADPVT
jgi:hypothetical protein